MDQQDQSQSLFEMEVDSGSQTHLLAISKWARFVAITVFVCIGLVLLALAASANEISNQFSSMYSIGDPSQVTAVVIIIIIVLGFCVLWFFFLFKAARLIKKGIYEKNSADLADGFKSLKTFFVFSMIISLLSILSTLSEMIK